ncbi:uracil-DNA glycosylase protein [Salinisphaera shabanensis E1L3A]|uniref:Uracil-DNA glycosylase protein n=1 Tax=Salinisphaera shabanensis E1L3A TaxID=1033802 RepID=U2FV51_9GAMM|nr:uracil-DNA glycosylase family protein [Salinisphaera shabanensis]ERJ18198.1 uracil-DNA glycosylase protein [Salinisphaera shabanensis E1L3A]
MSLSCEQRQTLRDLASETDGIDRPVYARFDKDPLEPIIGLGDTNTRIGFFGRDPGTDEVKYGEPFIGAGGQLVRKTIYRHLHGDDLPDFETSRALGQDFFWINTVPYKPIGNKAWSMKTKRRFQPTMISLLVEQWQGRSLITLGREAFLWFGIGQSKDERARIESFWKRDDRFESAIEIELSAPNGQTATFDIRPLPHPSPLNATWYKRFPDLLRQRLEQLDVRIDTLRF